MKKLNGTVIVTYRCNARCTMCNRYKAPSLPEEEISILIKKLNGESAGKTIDKLGLKNVKIGQIQISQKHANFFVNLGNGTSKDLRNLIDQTKQIVKDKTGLELEEEVIFVAGIDKND